VRSTHRPRPSSIQRAIAEARKLANLVALMEEIGLFQVLYTDFTELVYADGHRKVILIPIIGHTSKMAFGWAVGESADTLLALQAWERAKNSFRQLEIPYYNTQRRHSSIGYMPPLTFFDKHSWTLKTDLESGPWTVPPCGQPADCPQGLVDAAR
jgi:transposase InsO family protein